MTSTKVIRMETGSISLLFNADLFTLTAAQRTLISTIADAVTEYERGLTGTDSSVYPDSSKVQKA